MGFYPSANSEYSQEKQLEFGREHSGVIGSCVIKFMVGLSSVGNGLLPILRLSFRHIFFLVLKLRCLIDPSSIMIGRRT